MISSLSSTCQKNNSILRWVRYSVGFMGWILIWVNVSVSRGGTRTLTYWKKSMLLIYQKTWPKMTQNYLENHLFTIPKTNCFSSFLEFPTEIKWIPLKHRKNCYRNLWTLNSQNRFKQDFDSTLHLKTLFPSNLMQENFLPSLSSFKTVEKCPFKAGQEHSPNLNTGLLCSNYSPI